MLIIKHTVETTATPKQVWLLWQDVESWSNWDHEIELFQLDGPFQSGTSGCLKMKDSPRLKIVLTHVEPFKMFVQETKLFLAKAISTQFINQVAGKTHVTFQVDIQGPLAFFWGWMLGSALKNKIPKEMDEMQKTLKALA